MKTISNINLGKRIKELRSCNHYSQEQVANYLELDQSYIAKIEKGERPIGLSKLQKLADLFGCNLKDIVSETYSAKPICIAYRSTLESEDLEMVAQIKRIALNIQSMEAMLDK